MSIENQPSFKSDYPDEEVPVADPSLEEVREEPDPNKEKTPPLPPEKIQEIIDRISDEEEEEKRHEDEVNEILDRIKEKGQ